MVNEVDLKLGDGRILHVYDTGADEGGFPVFWHHGTPNIGSPPAPLFAAAERLGLRWVSYDRPGYGGSTPDPGRDLGSAADLVSSVADALGIDRFAVMGHSGGGSHALACGALLEDRVLGVVSMAGLAPFDAGGLDWFAGMAASGVDSLRAAAAGSAEKHRYEASGAKYDPEFTPADEAALAGGWSWLLDVVRPALAQGPGGLIDDDLAYVAPWGAEVEQIRVPTLVLHGGRDRVVPSAHGEWLADRCPAAELRLSPDEGHISILGSSESALEWLRERPASGAAMENGQVGALDAYMLHPIGVVRSELVDRANAPRQGDEGAPDATIELVPAIQAGLDGIQEGQELIVLTWLHEAERDVLAVHPRDDLDRPLAGVFGTRSSDRPNPIGLHRVTVRAVDGGRLRVGPLEAIDGTPVLDIKPVLRQR